MVALVAFAAGVSAGCEDHPRWNGHDGGVDGNGEAGRKVTTRYEAIQEDLTGLDGHKPKFEPDYNTMVPQPWVEPATKAQSDEVSVFPDRLEFPVSRNEVLGWKEGRTVASAPGTGSGNNALGFARKVSRVEEQTGKIVVWTTTVGLEDIVQGDVQVTIKPEETVPVDLSKLDLAWVAANLYQSSEDDLSPGEPLVDDVQVTLQRTGLGSWLRKAARAVVKVIEKILPETLSGSVDLGGTLSKQASDRREFELSHTFKSKKGLAIEAALKGSAAYDALLEFRPGLQFGASIAMPGKNAHSKYWLNIDSYLKAKLSVDLNLEASLTSVDGEEPDAFEEKLAKATEYAQDVLNSKRDALFGDTDAKPVGGWRKPLLITKPSAKVFMAGPVPVVVTTTFQLDLECGFEAKASFSAHAGLEQTASLKFSVKYDTDPAAGAQPTVVGPTFDSRKTWELTATGEGEATISCGLIPRINVFAYDAVGVFAGVRATAIATAKYETSCDDAANTWWPTADMTLGLAANVGVQMGARVQVPGSSYAGAKAADKMGFDIGPLEPWSKEFKLAEKTWHFERGLGYCLPTCQNLALDDDESDIDCGGPCGSCTLGQKCTKSSECAAGACNAGTCQLAFCQDGVVDRDETDIDCGGATCAACVLGKGCLKGTDCASGFCSSSASTTPNRCVADRCGTGVRDGDEGGVDCGGATCAKCGAGVIVTAASHCASGLWNGTACVATTCEDRIVSGDETGIDCGGATCKARCGLGAGCAADGDCSDVAPRCDPARKVCLRAPGGSCATADQCSSHICDGAGKCTAPLCTDEVPNGDETDKDCGGTCPLKCGSGLNCKQGTDCQSGVCGVNNKCLAPSIALLQTDSTGLAFTDTETGATSAAASFVVTNAGQLTSSAITLELGGTNGGDFAIAPAVGGDCVSGTTTLAGGASCTVRVVFKPTASGRRSATLTFSAVAGGTGSVPLGGSGIYVPLGCGNAELTPDEACDDGNRDPNDGCAADCLDVDPGYSCVPAGQPCHRIVPCGDGQRAPTEACDDGNRALGDGCSSSCTIEVGWRCSGSRSICSRTTCGDGMTEGVESCDDGNIASFDGCSADCRIETTCGISGCVARCGDGFRQGELCDDGNTVAGDGCSASCDVETGYSCVDSSSSRIDLPVVYRDFKQKIPTDFEPAGGAGSAATPGLVAASLDSSGKPVYVGSYGYISGASSFNQWFRDVDGVNRSVARVLPLWKNAGGSYENRWGSSGELWQVTRQAPFCGFVGDEKTDGSGNRIPCTSKSSSTDCDSLDAGGLKQLSCTQSGSTWTATYAAEVPGTPVFFPVDDVTFSTERSVAKIEAPSYADSRMDEPGAPLHNFSFTSEIRHRFEYDPSRTYTLHFAGDDDVWVFVNGRLAIDLGGIHAPVMGSIAITSANAADFGLAGGGIYEVAVFHAERRTPVSSFHLAMTGFEPWSSLCRPMCGDGMIASGEECDEGPTGNTGGYGRCSADCKLTQFCGDGIVQPGYEDCDGAPTPEGAACPTSCRLVVIP